MKYLKTPTSGYGKIFKITTIVLVLAAAAASIGQSKTQTPFPRQMAWGCLQSGYHRLQSGRCNRRYAAGKV
ncbi:MAG: hypothetical protein CM1200mP40_16470 [Gammaproteobacteria bacterium]|nr:MAG: hypothetical protein CM1200mP40_16470 [Gammaproteobacteria bacterium]